MNIIHPMKIVPYGDPGNRWQVESIDALDRTHFPYTVEPVVKDDDYWLTLMSYWNRDDLLIVEQDIMPTADHIEGLLSCPYDACTVPYYLAEDRLSIFRFIGRENAPQNAHYRPEDRPDFCEGSSIGLVKLTRHAQSHVRLHAQPYLRHWSMNDFWISRELWNAKIPWHVHYPGVRHRDMDWR